MSKIRILATEDDPIHEAKLRMVMDSLKYDLIDVIVDPHQVIPIIRATNPDILLMDVDLNSDISGIDLVNKINELFDIPTVFLTSFHDASTFNKAKETQPVAYITKPYKAEELERSIALAIFNKQKERIGIASSINTRITKHLFVKDGASLTKVLLSDIRYIEAYDKYCYIHLQNKKYMIKERLKNISEKFPDDLFLQVHRSYIINLEAIDDIKLTQNMLLIGEKKIGIGKTYRRAFLSRISIL
ncbi:LytTR family two component transcriptional regulator [Gillisia sp. Hel_I_86]|uniref:LytR/AlgR family response regulator transcription factor n=1 Tax=Gillisia sp. Hel_I_86 TaxID=1249981 RepID=UPI00119955DB|nr:response regulator transcription factor [Gillisia sp. Hel_I_86]TVZ26916.1 LytTR family two component transcriptional regulator [Gillisia sp. Hel_I_86]